MEPEKTRFVLRDPVEEELWHLVDQVSASASQDLLQVEGELVDALKKACAARRASSEEMLRLISRLKRISGDKSRFLHEEHASRGREEEARRRAVDLVREMESAQSVVGHERDRATTAEKAPEAVRSSLGWSASLESLLKSSRVHER